MHAAYFYRTGGLCPEGLCPGGLCLGGLRVEGVSLQGGLCSGGGGSVWGFSVRKGYLSEGGLCREDPSPLKILRCPKLRLRAVNIPTFRVYLHSILQYIHEESYRNNVTGHFEFLFSSGPST